MLFNKTCSASMQFCWVILILTAAAIFHVPYVDSENIEENDTTSSETTPTTGALEKVQQKQNISCKTDLLPGQYVCMEVPEINITSQQPINCQKNGRAINAFHCNVSESIANEYQCKETGNKTFYRDFDGCKWTNGYEFDTALLLSIFLGMFGVDRFYLGYPAIGLLKFSTLGFFFLGHLLDVILIASQILKPADGSYYVISYFGPAINILTTNDGTDRRPESDWFEPPTHA